MCWLETTFKFDHQTNYFIKGNWTSVAFSPATNWTQDTGLLGLQLSEFCVSKFLQTCYWWPFLSILLLTLPLVSPLQILFMGMMTEYYHYFFTTLVSAPGKNAVRKRAPHTTSQAASPETKCCYCPGESLDFPKTPLNSVLLSNRYLYFF